MTNEEFEKELLRYKQIIASLKARSDFEPETMNSLDENQIFQQGFEEGYTKALEEITASGDPYDIGYDEGWEACEKCYAIKP